MTGLRCQIIERAVYLHNMHSNLLRSFAIDDYTANTTKTPWVSANLVTFMDVIVNVIVVDRPMLKLGEPDNTEQLWNCFSV